MKPFIVIQRVRLPPGKGAARQPESSVAWRTATCVVKRTQRVVKRHVEPRNAQCRCLRVPDSGGSTGTAATGEADRTDRGPRTSQSHGMDHQGTWEARPRPCAGIAGRGTASANNPAPGPEQALTTDDDEEKATNEIGVFIPTMDLVPDIAGRTVTVDALLTQTAISAYLHDRGAHFMFVAKGNQKNLLREIKAHFASQFPRAADFATRSPQPEHERIEQREIWVSTDPVHRISFPWVGQVFMIKRTVREYRCARNGKPAWIGEPSVEIVCGITSHTPETAGAEGAPGLQPRALVMRARPPDPGRRRDLERGQVPGPQRAWPGES